MKNSTYEAKTDEALKLIAEGKIDPDDTRIAICYEELEQPEPEDFQC